jgi:FSR family fosmidomycin resistance protein-like MFS transporter
MRVGAKLGLLATVVGTELGTAAAIFAVLALPLAPTLILLPFLGIALNGTSSVLYGTVPELVAGDKVEHAFALFYSGTLGSSALVPVILGTFGDWAGPSWATAVGASAALCVIPLMVLLAPRLALDVPGPVR